MLYAIAAGFCFLCSMLPLFAFARDAGAVIDQSQIPLEAGSFDEFIPQGWRLESQTSGDLNGDSVSDYALTLVEDKPARKDGFPIERRRALVLAFGSNGGRLSRVTVAGKLLQCTTCGGAFYGVVEAPANVKIERGVLIVEQDGGSRFVNNETYRFRYEPGSKRFQLIGYDLAIHDRLTGEKIAESTNCLSGARIITGGKDGNNLTSRKTVPKKKIYMEQVNREQYLTAGVTRLEAVQAMWSRQKKKRL